MDSDNCSLCGKEIGLNRYMIAKTASGKILWKCPACARKGGYLKVEGERAFFCDKEGNPIDDSTQSAQQSSKTQSTSSKKYAGIFVIVAVLVWIMICASIGRLIDSIFLGTLIGTVATVLTVMLTLICISAIKTLQAAKTSATPEITRKGGLQQLAIFLPFEIIAIVVLVVVFVSSLNVGDNSHKCLRCGEKGNYSNGYCYSCYKDIEDVVKDDFYDYYE